jgi:hypothetical protein
VWDIDVATVVEALDFLQNELQRRLLEQVGSATFYAWYDNQAHQLSSSLTSARRTDSRSERPTA